MGEECGTYEERQRYVRGGFFWWKSEVNVERRTEVGWDWIRMMRLRIGTGDGLEWKRWWTSRLHKMWGKPWIPEDLLASRQKFCSTDFVGWLVGKLMAAVCFQLTGNGCDLSENTRCTSHPPLTMACLYHINPKSGHHTTAGVLSETIKQTPLITLTFA